MRSWFLVPALTAGLLAGPAAAQSAEDEVLAVVDRLFDGMRSADTTMMRSTFHPEVRLVTTGEQDGRPVASLVPVERWLEAVAGADVVLDERLYDAKVQVAGSLASVWAFYTLHAGDRFSHCGYDAFQLVRTTDGWKITQVADTRQREGCDTPEPGA